MQPVVLSFRQTHARPNNAALPFPAYRADRVPRHFSTIRGRFPHVPGARIPSTEFHPKRRPGSDQHLNPTNALQASDFPFGKTPTRRSNPDSVSNADPAVSANAFAPASAAFRPYSQEIDSLRPHRLLLPATSQSAGDPPRPPPAREASSRSRPQHSHPRLRRQDAGLAQDPDTRPPSAILPLQPPFTGQSAWVMPTDPTPTHKKSGSQFGSRFER